MLLPALLREFLFVQAFLYISVAAGQNIERRKAFFARDPPKPTQSDTAETSTTMSANEGVAIPGGGDQRTTPSPSSTPGTNSPAQAPIFFARDPPRPSQSSETTETPDNESTRTSKEPESDLRTTKDPSEDVTTTITTKEPESELRTTKDPSEDVTTVTTKEPESDDENSKNNERQDARPVESSRNPSDPSDSHSKEPHAHNVEGFRQLSINHVSSKEPHDHVQTSSSGVVIPVSPEETTSNRRNSKPRTTEASSASSQSRDPGERSSRARSMQLTIIKFFLDTMTKLTPRRNMRSAFDMSNMSAKTVKTLIYGIVFHFPNGTEIPDAENTCQVLDTALSDNFERVKPLKNSLLRILVNAAAQFLMFSKVLGPQYESYLSDWFFTCFEDSLGHVRNPTEKQSMYAIGDGFVNFLDSMDLYLPSSAQVLAKYIADGLYAVI